MSTSLASSPPQPGSSPPPNKSWALMQAYEEAQMQQQSIEAASMGQGDGYSMADMSHMCRNDMTAPRASMDKRMASGMYSAEGHASASSQFAAQMHHMPPGYHGGSSAAYMHHMAADRDYSAEMDEFAEYPGGMKLNSVSSAVREVATRMNQVRLGQAHNGQMPSHMMPSQHQMDQHEAMAAEYAQRANADLLASMRARMGMGSASQAQMMRSHSHGAHHSKMHHAYANSMLMNLAHAGVPYIAAQPQCLPFGAMHAGGYGGAGGVTGGGMGGAGSFDMMHRTGTGTQAAKHNKYCHFCQHVKVRASGMLACCNKDCTRRFCEHCLSKSIGDDVNPQTSSAWVNGQWHCPVCRKLCCCAIGDCDKNHRHCKAYRYRVRRAEQQAVKRAGTSGEAGDMAGVLAHASLATGNHAPAVKPEQAVEIADERPSVAGAISAAIVEPMPISITGVTANVQHAGLVSLAPGDCAPISRVKMEHEQHDDEQNYDEQQQLSRDAASSPPSSAAPLTGDHVMASPSSMLHSHSMPQARRQQRRGDIGAIAPAAPVDVNDVQTMADSWLRLLEEEEDDECDFMNGSEGGSFGRGAGGGVARGLAGTLPLDLEGEGSFSDDGVGNGHATHGRMVRPASKKTLSTLSHLGSNDSLNRIMSVEDGGGNMVTSASSLSLSELIQRDTMSRNFSRDQLMLSDTLSRNASNTSLTDMVRNYSSGSLQAVMEHPCLEHPCLVDQAEPWMPHAPAAAALDGGSSSSKMGGGDFEFLQSAPEVRAGRGSEGHAEPANPDLYFLSARGGGMRNSSSEHAMHAPEHADRRASTGKRMQRTNSHNKLVNHEAVHAVSTMGKGLPRPASYEKLSRQCAADDAADDALFQAMAAQKTP